MSLPIQQNASLATLNTFGVAARARRLVVVDDESGLTDALREIDRDSRLLVLGGGSNVLFTGDFDGTVVLLRTRGMRVLEDSADGVIVEARGGEPWDAFVRWTLDLGLAGLENLSLIPGTVGASPIQNIGAYGVEMRESFDGLTAIAIDGSRRREFRPEECGFGYRDSVFKGNEAGRWLITRVRFRLHRQPRLRLDYGEIREMLREAGCLAPGPKDVAAAVRAIRRRKLPDPAVTGNAGSFFRNPVVDAEVANALRSRHPELPCWPADGRVKLSAAWMIERCGWKGFREGDAGVHERHALVLVNHGHASGAQVLALASRIITSVRSAFGVDLEPEPAIL